MGKSTQGRAGKDLQKAADGKMPLPLGQRVMGKKIVKHEKKTASGLILPESAKMTEDGDAMEIVALSPHLTEEWTNYLAVGDSIIYSRINNDEVKMGTETYILIPVENILGKLP